MSLLPILSLVIIMFLVVRTFGGDAIGGASQLALILSSGLGIALAMLVYKCPWERLEAAILENIRGVGSGILILLMIGVISGTWMVSGVVPTLICYGLKIISPAVFYFAICLICAVVSIVTGSSWTTVATIGVAMLGIGNALGFPEAVTAGAILSGAYFGDKISPLSDTTVMASASADVPLFTHIRYMLVTTVPSFTITVIAFLVLSLCHKEVDVAQGNLTADVLRSTFTISPWLLLVPAFSGFLIYKKVPAFLTLLLSSIAACIAAFIAQLDIIREVAANSTQEIIQYTGMDWMKGVMITCFGATGIETGNESVNELISTSGMNGMMPTVFLIICAAAFGGVLRGSGMIQSLTDALTRSIKSRTSLVASTVTTGFFSNLTMGDQYLSIILTCNLFKRLYGEMGYENRLLSRSVEDSATVTSVLIPWTSCGMTQSTVLRVATMDYLPYCFFNLLSPLMSVLMAAIGFKIVKPAKCE